MMSLGKTTNRIGISKFATFIFIFFIFFSFFGTQLPFQERTTEIEDIGTSNVFNQFVYVIVFLGAIITLWSRRDRFIRLVKEEKFLSLLLFWCLISIFWSEFRYVSFKRVFQLITDFMACGSILLFAKEEAQILKIIKYIVYFFLVTNLVAILVIPAALDPVHGSFRGITSQKNQLGQESLLCLILLFIIISQEANPKRKIATYIMIFLALFLLIGSLSTTAIMNLSIIAICVAITNFNSALKKLGIGNFFILSFLLLGFICGLSVLLISPKTFSIIPEFFGKDLTFSGRVDLWKLVFEEINQHFLFGTGYQGFWVVDNPKTLALYNSLFWIPFQAHNGYIDILNELGVIGFLIFIFCISRYFYFSFKTKISKRWNWIVIMVLIQNFQETTIFRPGQLNSIFFIFAYMLCFYTMMNKNIQHYKY